MSREERKALTERAPANEPANIKQYLDRMTSDLNAIQHRLLTAPADLTGKPEANIWLVLERIRQDLIAAKKMWQ